MKLCNLAIRTEGRLIRTARLDGDKYEVVQDPEAMLNELRSSGLGVDIFTFIQRISEPSPRFSYPMEWDNLAVLPISTFEHWWTQQIRSYPRNRARQAEKRGVVLRELPYDEALVRGIWEVYNECPYRGGKPFGHYGMTLERVREYAGTYLDRSFFIGAFLGEQMIGFIKVIIDTTGTQACLVHIVSMMSQRDKAPTNALLAQAVRSCAERHIPYLIYQNFAYGKKQQDSLSHFKEVNGFQRVDLPRYYIPLTVKGRLALKLGLHRRFVDRFPAPMLEKLRDLRTAWYERKFRAWQEGSQG